MQLIEGGAWRDDRQGAADPAAAADGIRRSIRREFPITLAFYPLWIAAELMAIFYPNTYWNKNGKRVVVASWSLCWLGLLSWLGAGTWLLFTIGT